MSGCETVASLDHFAAEIVFRLKLNKSEAGAESEIRDNVGSNSFRTGTREDNADSYSRKGQRKTVPVKQKEESSDRHPLSSIEVHEGKLMNGAN
jgi:hypothetical protein